MEDIKVISDTFLNLAIHLSKYITFTTELVLIKLRAIRLKEATLTGEKHPTVMFICSQHIGFTKEATQSPGTTSITDKLISPSEIYSITLENTEAHYL